MEKENPMEDITEESVEKQLEELGYTVWDLYSKVSSEYEESIQFTEAKRTVFKRRDRLYWGIKDQEDKIYVDMVFAVVDTLLALEHSDERSVIFNGRQVWADDYAENINNVAKYDFEQMNCEAKKYEVRKDKYLRWAGVEVMDNWDNTLSCPEYKVIDPLVWCPDWFSNVNSWPRYHWFEFQATRWELENNESYFDVDDLQTTEQANELVQKAQNSAYDNRELNTYISNKPSDILNIYYHYTKLNGRPYLTVWGNNKSKLIRFEEIPAMTDIEKQDPSKIQFPVVVRHWRPTRYDPFGISIPDLLEDKESMKQLLINLNAIKAKHEALWDMFLFDPDKVDVNNINIPAIWPKYIPVTWLWAMQWGQVPMMEVPKWQIKADAFNMWDVVTNEWMLAIGMDNQTLWVQWDKNITATENQRVQWNANLRLMLGIKWDNYAEKQFRLLWYKFYLFYFNDNKEKNFALNDSVGAVYYSVKKKDFLGLTDIDITIKSKADLEAQKEKEKLGIMAMAQFTISDPNAKPSQKAFLLREMYRLNWMPQEKINRVVQMPDEERKALSHIALLNKNEMPPKITNLDEDHRTYITIYDRAFNTDAKWKAIERRKLAMEMSWQNMPQMPMQQQGGNAMSNMVTNDMLQQSNKVQNGVQSLQSLQSISR